MFEVRKFFVRTDRTQGLSEQFGRQFGEPSPATSTNCCVGLVYACANSLALADSCGPLYYYYIEW